MWGQAPGPLKLGGKSLVASAVVKVGSMSCPVIATHQVRLAPAVSPSWDYTALLPRLALAI